MDKLSLVHRIMLGRAFTIGMIAVALGLVVPITWVEVMDWVFPAQASATAGADPLGAQHGQASVAVVLVALGVILEGRSTFVHKVMKIYRLHHLPGQEEFNDTCELYGFYILVLGLLIECCGELDKFFGLQSRWALLVFGGLSVALNLAAMVFLLRLCVEVARLRLTDPASEGSIGE
jgi:hypothetical protein